MSQMTMTAEQQKHELRFKSVSNSLDWKSPIDAIIRVADFDAVNAAVEFYTATKLKVEQNMGSGYVRVTSPGYRLGPAGDH